LAMPSGQRLDRSAGLSLGIWASPEVTRRSQRRLLGRSFAGEPDTICLGLRLIKKYASCICDGTCWRDVTHFFFCEQYHTLLNSGSQAMLIAPVVGDPKISGEPP